jgi:hypothetical protein
LIFGVLAVIFFNTILIIASSVAGSFIFVFSLSIVFGRFPDIYALA